MTLTISSFLKKFQQLGFYLCKRFFFFLEKFEIYGFVEQVKQVIMAKVVQACNVPAGMREG